MHTGWTLTLAGLAALLVACPEQTARAPAGPTVVRLPDLILARCAVATAPTQIDRGTGIFEDVLVGEGLRPGDRVRTGPLGSARVDFPSGGGLRLGESSEVRLDSMARVGAMRAVPALTVAAGALVGFLDPPAGQVRPRLYFRAASLPILVESRGDRPLLVRASKTFDGLEFAAVQGEGAVLYSGLERPLQPGQYVEVAAGTLREPKDLPSPPELLSPLPDDRFLCPGLVARLAWKAAPDATTYFVQVAVDPEFQTLALAGEAPLPHTLFVPRAPGRYLWRVGARDAAGRLGPFSAPRPLFCEARPPEDLLGPPANGAVVRYFGVTPKLTFKWRPWPGASAYRFVATRGADLGAKDATVLTSKEPTLDLETLEEGEYLWAVWTDEPFGQPLFLAPRRLQLVRSRVKTPTTLQQWGQ